MTPDRQMIEEFIKRNVTEDHVTLKAICVMALQALDMQWVPVSERLPHTHTVLGVVHDYPKGSEPFVDCVCYFPEHDSQRLLKCENLGWRFNGDESAGELNVSHWCELPAAPHSGGTE